MKRVIVKVFTWALFITVGGGMLTLLIAANRKQKTNVCRDIMIVIKGEGEQFFVDKNDILKTLTYVAGGSLINKPVGQVNLSHIEEFLEKNAWIRDAELYFDNKNILHVTVKEREPIARIITIAGNSFYIDHTGQQMPLLHKESARVLVITNFTAARKYNTLDSAMAADVTLIANAIYKNEFWREQIGQVDITPKGNYEAIPVIGNHLIRFGKADGIEKKLNRLFLFYKQVLSKTGFDKYAAIDLQYENQVVGIHHGATSAIDSVQLQKNIEELLSRSNMQMQDSTGATGAQVILRDSILSLPVKITDTISNPAKLPDQPLKTTTNDSVNRRSSPARRPLAVMPRRQQH